MPSQTEAPKKRRKMGVKSVYTLSLCIISLCVKYYLGRTVGGGGVTGCDRLGFVKLAFSQKQPVKYLMINQGIKLGIQSRNQNVDKIYGYLVGFILECIARHV